MKSPAPTAHIIVNRVKNGPANIHNKEMNRGPNGPSDIQRLVSASNAEQQADGIAKIDFNPYVLTEYELHATRMTALSYV